MTLERKATFDWDKKSLEVCTSRFQLYKRIKDSGFDVGRAQKNLRTIYEGQIELIGRVTDSEVKARKEKLFDFDVEGEDAKEIKNSLFTIQRAQATIGFTAHDRIFNASEELDEDIMNGKVQHVLFGEEYADNEELTQYLFDTQDTTAVYGLLFDLLEDATKFEPEKKFVAVAKAPAFRKNFKTRTEEISEKDGEQS